MQCKSTNFPPIYLQCLLIAVAVLIVFSPAVFAEFSNIDDQKMVTGLRRVENFDLVSVFIPGAGGGLYYRPIISLSFLFDRFVFGVSAPWMHIHNILIHLANTLLVFLLARRTTVQELGEKSLLPLTVSLLFGLHPLSTESVNWISGRTDLLSGFFLLLATLCLLRYRHAHSRLYLYLTLLLMALATLTKEFALAFLPGAALILAVRGGTTTISESFKNRSRTVLAVASISALVVALFFALRMVAYSSNSSRIGMTFKFLFVDPLHTAKVFAGAFAFYLKKIFIPWPLNFAIVEIDPLYELLAVPLLLICFFAFYKRTMTLAMFLTGILLFTPSFIIAFNQIAWTPYAERYAYLSAAYVLLGVAWYVTTRWNQQLKTFLLPVVTFLVCLAGGTTMARNFVWQSNFSLAQDTVTKSPNVADIRLLYGAQLAARGRFDEALIQFEQGKRLPHLGYNEHFDLNIAAVYLQRHQTNEAILLLQDAMKRSKGRSIKVSSELIVLLERKLAKTKTAKERSALGRSIIEMRKDLYRLTHDSSQFEAMHKIASRIGDTALEQRLSSLYAGSSVKALNGDVND